MRLPCWSCMEKSPRTPLSSCLQHLALNRREVFCFPWGAMRPCCPQGPGASPACRQWGTLSLEGLSMWVPWASEVALAGPAAPQWPWMGLGQGHRPSVRVSPPFPPPHTRTGLQQLWSVYVRPFSPGADGCPPSPAPLFWSVRHVCPTPLAAGAPPPGVSATICNTSAWGGGGGL